MSIRFYVILKIFADFLFYFFYCDVLGILKMIIFFLFSLVSFSSTRSGMLLCIWILCAILFTSSYVYERTIVVRLSLQWSSIFSEDLLMS